MVKNFFLLPRLLLLSFSRRTYKASRVKVIGTGASKRRVLYVSVFCLLPPRPQLLRRLRCHNLMLALENKTGD